MFSHNFSGGRFLLFSRYSNSVVFTTTPALNSDLMKTTDLGGTWQKLLSHVYTFGTQGSFLFASITPAGVSGAEGCKISHCSQYVDNQGSTFPGVQGHMPLDFAVGP